MSAGQGAKAAASARNAISSYKKYTVQSTGIWERIRRALAVDPDRSSGIPLTLYRNPTPGGVDPLSFDDPTTIPAGDIAENPYYKRDMRRSYPQLSTVSQADVVGLLSVGSKSSPKEDVLQIGDAGAKQLVQVKQDGEEKGLAAFFEKDKKNMAGVLGPTGLPPMPAGLSRAPKGKQYVMDQDREQGFPEEYVSIVLIVNDH
ncbi:MAG: hypothetical protein M1827_005391 [Pycnora praestabilis]|nr:MAG: hypothetical protein M1827_005391 [Pycnora praestabilis]